MWLEIGLLHIFKEGKMFMVHTSRFTKTFKVQGHKQCSVVQGEHYNLIQMGVTKVQNYFKCLNISQE